MAYNITLTNGQKLATILDGTVNTSTGVTLIGRNYPSYGLLENENLVHMLENFAGNVAPTVSVLATNVLTGTLWYDTGVGQLKVYDGSTFYPVSQHFSANAAPTATHQGDTWYHTNDKQLFTWSGTQWQLIGPSFTSAQGKTGSFAETIKNNANADQVVVGTYTAGNLVAVSSNNAAFIPMNTSGGYTGLPSIRQGFNVLANAYVGNQLTVNGNAYIGSGLNLTGKLSVSLAQAGAMIVPAITSTYDIGTPAAAVRNQYFGGNVVFNNIANIGHNSATGTLRIENRFVKGNISFVANTQIGMPITMLHLDPLAGTVSVYADPIAPLNVATKNYVDEEIITLASTVSDNYDTVTQSVTTLSNNVYANIGSVINNNNTNLSSAKLDLQNQITANAMSLTSLINAVGGNPVINYDNMPMAILRAAVGLEPESGLLKEVINGKRLGDITSSGNGIVSSADALAYLRYLVQGDQTYAGYINSVLHPTFLSNVSKYSVFFNSIDNGFANIAMGLRSANASIITANTDMKSYVDSAINGLSSTTGNLANLISTAINTEIVARNSAISANVSGLAPNASPTFTGVPKAPTAAAGTNTTQIATTEFVNSAINAQRLRYTVSTNPPSGGQDGDFWFQIDNTII